MSDVVKSNDFDLGRFQTTYLDMVRNFSGGKLAALPFYDVRHYCGYPSAAFIFYLLSKKIHFLMRVSSSFYKEVNDSTAPDEWVEIETLITDVPVDEISYKESKKLYFKRWGIETRFNELKHQFEIENFLGETPAVIE